MAPEILSGKSYGRQADIWAIGVLLYVLLVAEFPFKGINILDEIKTRCSSSFSFYDVGKVRGIKSKKQEILLLDFFQHLFEIDPAKRFSIHQILNHGLMRE